ncbi:hypothetical protein K2V58_00400 [Staphylococcus arlettae]|uniref:hypothetical protein n=1 Tax=Staphylococcus arlettae TaxID=29378 RepID=UPI001E3BF462|nr:hypothetical protein [Staphylococcus arlettae]MCD8832766.1 hypothetical protein [Staphylococcus arlettae]
MKFVIAKIEFFERLGYNTKYWRKSVDEIKTICHLEYAEILVHDLENNSNVQIVDATEAQNIMDTDEWSINK